MVSTELNSLNGTTRYEERICWLCYVSDSESDIANLSGWSHPCMCRGGTGWIHQSCLQRLVDDQQRGDLTAPVICKICGYQYVIMYPAQGFLLRCIGMADRLCGMMVGYLAGSICIIGLFWSATSFGAFTLMQLMGAESALDAIATADPVITLIGLPAIPFILAIGQFLHWEDCVLHVWRRYVCRLPIIRSFCSIAHVPEWRDTKFWEPKPNVTMIPRMFCNAVFMPTFASVTGRLCFWQVQSILRRSLLGGLLFVSMKGFVNIYYREGTYLRACQRSILDYELYNQRQRTSSNQ